MRTVLSYLYLKIKQFLGPITGITYVMQVKIYCRMLQGKHSAILLTSIKLPFVIKIFVLCVFELPFYSGFTVICIITQVRSQEYLSSGLVSR